METPDIPLDEVKQRGICAVLAVGGKRRLAARYVGCSVNAIRQTALVDEDFVLASPFATPPVNGGLDGLSVIQGRLRRCEGTISGQYGQERNLDFDMDSYSRAHVLFPNDKRTWDESRLPGVYLDGLKLFDDLPGADPSRRYVANGSTAVLRAGGTVGPTLPSVRVGRADGSDLIPAGVSIRNGEVYMVEARYTIDPATRAYLQSQNGPNNVATAYWNVPGASVPTDLGQNWFCYPDESGPHFMRQQFSATADSAAGLRLTAFPFQGLLSGPTRDLSLSITEIKLRTGDWLNRDEGFARRRASKCRSGRRRKS